MKISEIYDINVKNEPCDLYLTLPKVETYGPYPQYKYGSSGKSSENLCGYAISYSNIEANNLFQDILDIVSKKFKRINIKPVVTTSKYGRDVIYFELKMSGTNISTRFYSG